MSPGPDGVNRGKRRGEGTSILTPMRSHNYALPVNPIGGKQVDVSTRSEGTMRRQVLRPARPICLLVKTHMVKRSLSS